MKTCNGDYCNFKIINGSNAECSYDGYCDFQTPRDSRSWFTTTSMQTLPQPINPEPNKNVQS